MLILSQKISQLANTLIILNQTLYYITFKCKFRTFLYFKLFKLKQQKQFVTISDPFTLS